MRRIMRPIVLMGLSVLPLAGCADRFLGRQPDRSQMVFMINAPTDARWTATTREAAATPANRAVLDRARPKTITGEVIDVSCWLQLGKRGEAHVTCGQKCVRRGQPIGLLTDKGKLYLILAEEHHPRRDGTVSIKERFAELMGKRVRVSGMVTKYNDYRALFVQTLPAEQ